MFSLDKESLDIEKLTELTEALEKEVNSLAGIFPDFREIEQYIKNNKIKRVFAITGLEGSGKATLVNALLTHDILPRGLPKRSAFTTRVCHSDKESFRVNLFSSQELRESIKHHFRVLGFQFKIPQDLYTRDAADELMKLLKYLKQDSKNFQRLFANGPSFKSIKKTSNSLNMLDKLITGLAGIHGAVDPKVMSEINKSFFLELYSHQKDRFLNWVSSAGPGALIRSLRIQTPFPKSLDPNVEFLIFHGNLIRDSSLRKAFSNVLTSVEHVQYVLSSETGLTVQDRNFFKFLIENNLKEKVSAVLNIDARAPKPVDEMQSSTGLMRSTLSELIVEDIRIHPINAYKELMDTTKVEKSKEIESIWTEQKSQNALGPLSNEFAAFAKSFSSENNSHNNIEVAIAAAENAVVTSEVILSQDEKLLGVSSGRVEEQAFEQSLFQLESDQRVRVKDKIEASLLGIYRQPGGVFLQASQLMNRNLTDILGACPMPPELENVASGGYIFDRAMESVHEQWLSLGGSLKSSVYSISLEIFRGEFEATLRSTFAVLEKFDTALSKNKNKDEFIHKTITRMLQKLDLRVMSVRQPEVLIPLAVSFSSRKRMIAEFYETKMSKKIMSVLTKNKFGRTAAQRVWYETRFLAYAENAEKIDKLFYASLQAILRNYYLYISEKTMQDFRNLLIEEAKFQYSNVWKRESAKMIKLSEEEQSVLIDYMNKLKAG